MSSPRVLIVDDDRSTLRLLQAMLLADGIPTATADSGETALARLDQESFELVLLDVRMPGMDGYEVCRRIRARNDPHHLPVLFISAEGESAELDGLTAGAEEFLHKPVRREALVARVRNFLRLSETERSARGQLAAQLATVEREACELVTERISVIGSIAAGVAHEVNNPLAWIVSNVAFVRKSLRELKPFPSEEEEALADAADGAGRIRGIVLDLQLFAGGTEAVETLVDLNRVVRAAVALAGLELRRRATVTLDLGEVPLVFGHGPRLAQLVLCMLVGSAERLADGSSRGSRISVRTRELGAELALELTATRATVDDVPARGAFTPLLETERGRSLGAQVCRKLAGELGGTFELVSHSPTETTFRLRLPTAAPRAAVG